MTHTDRFQEIDRNLRNFSRRAQRYGIIESLGGGWFRVKGHGKVQGLHPVYRAAHSVARRIGGEYREQFRAAWFGWRVQA